MIAFDANKSTSYAMFKHPEIVGFLPVSRFDL